MRRTTVYHMQLRWRDKISIKQDSDRHAESHRNESFQPGDAETSLVPGETKSMLRCSTGFPSDAFLVVVGRRKAVRFHNPSLFTCRIASLHISEITSFYYSAANVAHSLRKKDDRYAHILLPIK